MKVSVVISACNNRAKLFGRSLYTFTKQTLPKEEFELILVDDAKRDDLFDLCKKYHEEHNINFQYVRIDPEKGFHPAKSFTPALTNNVGFRCALAGVVVITGPEIMQAENNMKVAASMINRKECAYGLVYSSSPMFNEYISRKKDWKKQPFSAILKYPGAVIDCLTRPPHPPAYWFCMAVKKEYVFKIRGVDEKFLGGICGEDDDFANRMRMSGVTPVFEHNIVGIHQDHSVNDRDDGNHNVRFDTVNWEKLRSHNLKIMYANLREKVVVANEDHEWGDLNTIIERESFGLSAVE